MPRGKTSPAEPTCLYPSESEIARLVLGERSAMWDVISTGLESRGLPPVDSTFGGRYWPAVRAFLDRRNRIAPDGTTAEIPDGHRRQAARARS